LPTQARYKTGAGCIFMAVLKIANLALSFILELCAFAAYGYWASRLSDNLFIQITFGIGAALVAILFWGLVMSPRAQYPVSPTIHIALSLIFFGLAAWGLYITGAHTLALWFAGLIIINHTFQHLLGQ